MRVQTGRWFPPSLFSLCVLCGESSAAPPAITYLYPAGAQRGTTVEVTATGMFDPWPTTVWTSGKDVSVEAAKEKGKLKITVAKDADPGVCWLRAYNAEGASTLRPFIIGTLPEIAGKEPNDEIKNPQPIDGNAVVNGKLEKLGDVDCFAMSLKKGQTLVASLESHHSLRSPMDAILQIVSADGFVLDENHDFRGLDPQLAFTAKKDGVYLVRLFAFPSNPDSNIRFFGSDACVYRLTLTIGPFANFAVPSADGAVIYGWNIPKAGRRVAEPMLAPAETHATLFDPDIANPVRMRIEPHPHHVALEPSNAPQFTVPFSITARLREKGGAYRVPVTLKMGKALSLQVESRAMGLPVNPVIEVFDKDAMRLARAEPGKLNGDTTLAFTPSADGSHTVTVSDLYGGGGSLRDVFLLRVVTPEPDYELSVAADRFAVVPGKPTAIPVKLTRKNGFAKPIDVVAEDLPGGVKFEITQPGKPDPNTISVTLTADKPVSGAFRLVGNVKDEPKLTRTARAPLAEFETTSDDLWVTVGVTAGIPPSPPKKKMN